MNPTSKSVFFIYCVKKSPVSIVLLSVFSSLTITGKRYLHTDIYIGVILLRKDGRNPTMNH